ncbi:hypothetical protein PybrP1_010712 [[Pythium] brassicae (nom. inval.)]|nr:hypothetical protein PybrP1_010712 [[Pythium] brassicae (nom. inval.)]
MSDAASALAWVRDEVDAAAAELQPALPPPDTPLCAFLRDGRALCLLATALEPTAALPKNLQRSLHQTSTFHSLERVQFFIKWSRAVLDAHLVFSSVQLLDEQNDAVVTASLAALRAKFRPHLKSFAADVAKQPSVRIAATSATHASNQDEVEGGEKGDEREAEAPPVAAAHPPIANSKLSAFLNKVPSKPNVLAPTAVAAVAAPAVAASPVEEANDSDSDDDDTNNENNDTNDNNAEKANEDDDEEVEPYDEDEHVAVTQQPPRGELADAFSPRSSISSSVSFSFTSDPRGHGSFSEDQPPVELSFASVTSSPPSSPKPPPRVRIPSIFKRNTATASVGASVGATGATPDRSNASSATPAPRDEATPRKLQIPSAFAASSSVANAAPPVAVAAPVAATVSAVLAEPAVVPAEPVTVPAEPEAAEALAAEAPAAEAASAAASAEVPLHKTVSKLSIPSAFTRSGSSSSSKSDKASPYTKPVPEAASPASPSPPVLTKKPSRLKIPSVFATGAAVAAAAPSVAVKQPEVVAEVVAAAISEEVVPETVEEAPTTSKEAVESKIDAVPRSPFAAFISSTPPSISRSTSGGVTADPAPAEAVEAEVVAPAAIPEAALEEIVPVKVEEAPTTPKKAVESAVGAVPRSPLAAFVGTTTPPAFSRSTSSNSPANPSSRLAAFLSKVEPPSTPVSAPVVAGNVKVTETTSVVDVSSTESVAETVAAAVEVVAEAATNEHHSSHSSSSDEQHEHLVKRDSKQRDEEVVTTQAPCEAAAPIEHRDEAVASRVATTEKSAAASRLAAFLSKVEPANVYSPASSQAEADEKAGAADEKEEGERQSSSESEDDDKDADERFSESQEAAIGVPASDHVDGAEEDEGQESDAESHSSDEERGVDEHFDERLSDDSAYDAPVSVEDASEALTDDEPAAEHDASATKDKDNDDGAERERLSVSSDESAAAEEATFEERLSDASTDVIEAAAAAALEATTSAPRSHTEREDDEEEEEHEVEHHAIDHHDHTDSEQPFFVVEEVSLSKPATSSKLYAFLNAVDRAPADCAQPHRFSHESSGVPDDDSAAEPTADSEPLAGATRSESSQHSEQTPRKSPRKSADASTTSEHSEQTPRNSVTATASASVVASSAVILEKERLSGENLALQLKLKATEDALAAQDSTVAALRAELAALHEQLAASQAHAVATASSHREELARAAKETRVARETLASAEQSARPLEARVAALEERSADLEVQLQLAKDSEEAARYAAQVAFAARDEMEARVRSQ